MSISCSTLSPNAIISNIKKPQPVKALRSPHSHNPAVTGARHDRQRPRALLRAIQGFLSQRQHNGRLDAGMALDLIYCDPEDPSAHTRTVPDYSSVFGIAAASGILSKQERVVCLSEVSDR